MTIIIDDRKTKRRCDFFTDFELELSYDAIGSKFSFGFYYNPENPEHRFIAQISKYQLVRVEHNGELLLTGLIMAQALSDAPEDQVVTFSGFSVPGVLETSTIPVSIYPLQADGLSLRQIAEKVLKPFMIKMEVDPAVADLMDQVYDKVTAEATQTVKDFLCELAIQKNIIVTHNAAGSVLFTKAKTDLKPILNFETGLIGTTLDLSFNGQGMHSPITVMKQADQDGGNAGQASIDNPYVPAETNAFFPKTIIQSTGDDNDTIKVAQQALAAELKNIQLTITTDRWEVDGLVIKPNNLVSVLSPKMFINKKENFFIEKVKLKGNAEAYTAVLGCVLPEVYNGKKPRNIFF